MAKSSNVESAMDKAMRVGANDQSLDKANLNKQEKHERIVAEQQITDVEEATKAQAMTPDQLEKVAQQLQEFMGEMNRSLEFLVDKDSGRDVIKVLDKGTGELVKQYPSEEVLTMISKLSDVTGNLIDTEI